MVERLDEDEGLICLMTGWVAGSLWGISHCNES